MKGPDRLRAFDNYWPTNKGAWFPGEKVRYRQMSLFDDFNDKSWMTLLLYGINGELPSEKHVEMIGKVWSLSASFPDPRLWNNRVSALAGTTRATAALAIAASTAVTQAKIYGSQPVFLGSNFLYDLQKQLSKGGEVEPVVLDFLQKHRYLPGFGRPLIAKDERIIPLKREIEALGFEGGAYLSLVNSIQEVLERKNYKLYPNIAIFCSAVFLDLGYTPFESYLVSVLAFSAGFFPCYTDSLEKTEGCFFPLSCSNINYAGKVTRRFIR